MENLFRTTQTVSVNMIRFNAIKLNSMYIIRNLKEIITWNVLIRD